MDKSDYVLPLIAVLLGVVLLFFTLILLSIFTDQSEERKFIAMPQELADCRFFFVQNRDGNQMTVARCPNSTTSVDVPSGKTKKTTVTIDGLESAPEMKCHPSILNGQ